MATVFIRYEDSEYGDVVERSVEVTVDEIDQRFSSASPSFRFIASVAEFAEIMRGSFWAEGGSLNDVLDEARDALRGMEAGDREDEFVQIVRTAISLRD